MWFEVISRLRINLDKSHFANGKSRECRDVRPRTWLQSGSSSFHLSGAPLGCSAQINGDLGWCEREDLEETSLVRQFISKGGRITLIQSTLVSMPIYLMSLMHMPRVAKLRLEQNPKGLSLGWGSFGEEASSCKVGNCLFR